MYTINIRGKQNPKDQKMVKLEMIFFKTGYTRVPKVLIYYRFIRGLRRQITEFPCRPCGSDCQEQTVVRFAYQIPAYGRHAGIGRTQQVSGSTFTLL